MRRLVLASASPARLGLLRAAGFAPEVRVSAVDEDAVAAGHPGAATADLVEHLAVAKALDVAAALAGADALVVGCDSLFEFDGQVWGKPGSAQVARDRIGRMQGGSGVLHTGHCVVDTASGAQASESVPTDVRFAPMTPDEIDAYVATGEPLQVAGSFTLDGRASVFVEGITGDPSNVIGLSLPTLRGLLTRVGVAVTDLWTRDP